MPIGIDEVLHESKLSDEDYVISKVGSSKDGSSSASKCWMMTAKTLFPRNFQVQLEAYTSMKNCSNPKEAARFFSSLFYDFPNESGLWEEVELIIEALQSNSSSSLSQFYRDLFSHMLQEVQLQLLLSTAERAQNILDHCQFMLVLFNKLPQSIDKHGKKLVDSLLAAEKQSCQTPLNCYRKLLVIDLLPLIIKSRTVDVSQKQLQILILKSIEFYISWLLVGPSVIQGLEEADFSLKAETIWNNLYNLITAPKLAWSLSSVVNAEFGNPELIIQHFQAFFHAKRSDMGSENSQNFQQLFICTIVLLLKSLFDYMEKLDPSTLYQNSNKGKQEDGPYLLVPSLSTALDIENTKESEMHIKRRKDERSHNITVTRSCSNAAAATLLTSFLSSVSCWNLLQQTEELRLEFAKLCLNLQTEKWTWLPTFIIDDYVYSAGIHAETIEKLKSIQNTANPLPFLIKSAGLYFSVGNYGAAVEQILHTITCLPEGTGEPPPLPISQLPTSLQSTPLHFMALTRPEIMQYCVSVLVASFRCRNVVSDIALGHLIVLLQYDWPNNAHILEDVIEKIRHSLRFTYQLFVSYVVQIDILEEFAYLATDSGGAINMDLGWNSATQLATQRRMTTRRGDLGAREDFRTAMKRQMNRSRENIEDLIIRFLMQERETLVSSILYVK